MLCLCVWVWFSLSELRPWICLSASPCTCLSFSPNLLFRSSSQNILSSIFRPERIEDALDLMKYKLIHKELLMATNMVHFPSGHNCIKKTITTSCNESLMVKFQADKFRNASNMLAVEPID